ncbi:MAG: TonB-dependent receptor [Kiritimatiellae bacterium]|nr:TonB-dependent receptor [Kiritimatiellia bacterium]
MSRFALFVSALCISLVMLVGSTASAAGDEEDLFSLSLEELLSRPVTLSTKTPMTIAQGPASISVYSSKEIQSLGVRSLSELLNLVPGFDVRRYRENIELIDVRGISGQFNERVLVMVDGVRVNDIYNGGIARTAKGIRLENIASVEILRGPGSVLYGTDAFAAVINLRTKKGSEVNGTQVGAEYGSFDEGHGYVLSGHQWGKHELQISFSYGEGDGDTYDMIDGTGRSGEVTDGYDEMAGSLKYNYGDRVTLSLNGGERNDSGFLTLSDLLGEDDDVDRGTWFTASLDLHQPVSDNVEWDTKLYGAFNRWDASMAVWPAGYGPAANPAGPYPNGMYGHPDVEDWRYGADSSVKWTLREDHDIILGAAVEQEETENCDHLSNGPQLTGAPKIDEGVFADDTRSIVAGYGQYSGPLTDRLLLNVGVRYDHYNDFGETVNPRASLVATPTDNTYGKLIYNRAFRAPTFRELYSANPVVRGDANNDAETIDSFELVLGYKSLPRFDSTLSLFYNKINDIIALQGVPDAPGVSIYQNRDEGNTYGFETEVRLQMTDDTTLIGNYSHIEGELTVNNSDYDLPFVATDIANLILVQSLGQRAQASVSLQYRGERERDQALGDPRPQIDDYLLANLHLRVFNVPAKGFEWFLTLKNILDEDFVGPSNYPPKVPGVTADDIPGERFHVITGVKYMFGRT